MVGTNDLKNGGTYYKVEDFLVHDDHNNPMYAYDIALIRVQGTIEFNDRVQPIELSTEEIEDGEAVTLTGWGYIDVKVSFVIANHLGDNSTNWNYYFCRTTRHIQNDCK